MELTNNVVLQHHSLVSTCVEERSTTIATIVSGKHKHVRSLFTTTSSSVTATQYSAGVAGLKNNMHCNKSLLHVTFMDTVEACMNCSYILRSHHPPRLQTIAEPTRALKRTRRTGFLRPRVMHGFIMLHTLNQDKVCTTCMIPGRQHYQQKAKLQSHSGTMLALARQGRPHTFNCCFLHSQQN